MQYQPPWQQAFEWTIWLIAPSVNMEDSYANCMGSQVRTLIKHSYEASLWPIPVGSFLGNWPYSGGFPTISNKIRQWRRKVRLPNFDQWGKSRSGSLTTSSFKQNIQDGIFRKKVISLWTTNGERKRRFAKFLDSWTSWLNFDFELHYCLCTFQISWLLLLPRRGPTNSALSRRISVLSVVLRRRKVDRKTVAVNSLFISSKPFWVRRRKSVRSDIMSQWGRRYRGRS